MPPLVIDVRWRLGGPPARPDYLQGHIPGAIFLDLDQITGKPGPGGRHPLPDPAALQEVLREAGVDTGSRVVAYDDGDSVAASRLWWTLRWAAHPDVVVLDGGFAAWTAAGRPVQAGEATAPAGDVVVVPHMMSVLDAEKAAELAADGVLIDARAAARYLGESEPVDAVAGHIPGAVNLPVAELSRDDGRLRKPAELRALFEQVGVGSGPVGAYCGSGVSAAKMLLALDVAGYADPALYVGSWSHWITDPQRPVATGPEPKPDEAPA